MCLINYENGKYGNIWPGMSSNDRAKSSCESYYMNSRRLSSARILKQVAHEQTEANINGIEITRLICHFILIPSLRRLSQPRETEMLVYIQAGQYLYSRPRSCRRSPSLGHAKRLKLAKRQTFTWNSYKLPHFIGEELFSCTPSAA